MPFRRFLYLIPAAALLAGCVGAKERRANARMQERILQKAASYGLVDVATVIPGIDIDLRYASKGNFSGRALYPSYMPCLLLGSTAERVRHAQALLNAQGYGLRIWDAWRPPEVQTWLYHASGRTGLFLDPRKGWSRHCGGVSVDATLVDLNGRAQRMPTEFDVPLGPETSSAYSGTDPEIRRNLHILHTAMRSAGLIPLDDEWWHFDSIDHVRAGVPVIRGAQIGVIVRP